MLILERWQPNDFLLTDEEFNESIIVPYNIAHEIKSSANTPGRLVSELYKYCGHNKKWKEILDRNLNRSNAIRENIDYLFNTFETLVK
jgi:hypothetical protein